MAFHAINGFDLTRMSPLILDTIPVAITVIDLEGRILYYNEYSTQIADRKAEYLGRDVRLCHEQPESRARIDEMLEEFKRGRRKEFYYEANRYGNRVAVTLSPLEVEGQLVGCIQSATIKA